MKKKTPSRSHVNSTSRKRRQYGMFSALDLYLKNYLMQLQKATQALEK